MTLMGLQLDKVRRGAVLSADATPTCRVGAGRGASPQPAACEYTKERAATAGPRLDASTQGVFTTCSVSHMPHSGRTGPRAVCAAGDGQGARLGTLGAVEAAAGPLDTGRTDKAIECAADPVDATAVGVTTQSRGNITGPHVHVADCGEILHDLLGEH